MKIRHLVWSAGFAMGCVAWGCGRGASAPVPPPAADAADAGFYDQAPWDDGKAEVNSYEVRGPNRPEAIEATMIVAASDTQVRLVWSGIDSTGIVSVRRMATVTAERSNGIAFRETFGSQERSGNTSKELRRLAPGRYRYRWSSYLDEEGDGEGTSEFDPAARVLFSDALPLWIRTLPQAGTHRRDPIRVRNLPSLWSHRAHPGNFRASEAAISIGGPDDVVVPAGTFRAWRYTVNFAGGGEEVFWCEDGGARRIVRMIRADGAQWRLRTTVRSITTPE